MERWYWIELIGFDNKSADYGVDAFLSRTVSITGVSLLFAHIDFIFSDSEELSDNACSYGGHEYNRERRRQKWTRTQLRGLVAALHDRGVKVFFSTFDMTAEITDPSWLCFNRFGQPASLVYVLKKGVGERVIDAIASVLDEFGFDGLQLGDGLSSNRRPIENGDFTAEFCECSGIDVPKRLMAESAYTERRAWILKNRRYEWSAYIARRWAEFYGKLFERIDKPIMFNMAWTRDPFEAFYRYGLDYRSCCTDKAFAVMIEENSATRAITAPEDEGGVDHPLEARDVFTYEYALMQQSVRLFTDGLRQISLMPISDTEEQWDALRHCPTELIRATVRRYNNFVYRNGRFEVCCDAPLYCLSDGIAAEDWRWLAKQESYRIPTPDLIDGFAAVANRKATHRELHLFCKRKSYYGSALHCELVMGGLNISAQLELSEVSDFDRAKCLVVTDLRGYTEEEKATLAEARLPILAVGEDVELPLPRKAYYKGKYVSAALYGDCPPVDLDGLSALDKTVRAKESPQGEKWTAPLSYPRIAKEFFVDLCKEMNEAFRADVSATPHAVKINSFVCDGDKYVILSNDLHTYCLAEVKTCVGVVEATALMKDKGYKVKINENGFTVRIPPRCVEIVKVKTDEMN